LERALRDCSFPIPSPLLFIHCCSVCLRQSVLVKFMYSTASSFPSTFCTTFFIMTVQKLELCYCSTFFRAFNLGRAFLACKKGRSGRGGDVETDLENVAGSCSRERGKGERERLVGKHPLLSKKLPPKLLVVRRKCLLHQ
jgi:hypothetical protein